MRKKEREVTNIAEIENIIAKADVCRIAISGTKAPYIVAMNFGYEKGNPSVLYFHCAGKGQKIDMLRINNYVCFQFDTDHNLFGGEKACDYSMEFKSVVGYGEINFVENDNEKRKALDTIMAQYAEKKEYEYSDKMLKITTILRLEIDEITGKAFQKK